MNKGTLLSHTPYSFSRTEDKNQSIQNLYSRNKDNITYTKTGIKDLSLVQCQSVVPILHDVDKAQIHLTIQGSQTIRTSKGVQHLPADHYLVTSPGTVVEHTASGTTNQPFLAFVVTIDERQLREIISLAPAQRPATRTPKAPQPPSFLCPHMMEAVNRLFHTLHSHWKVKALGSLYLREILFLALQGEQALALHYIAQQRDDNISRAVESIHQNYARNFKIEDYAKAANMSTSAFHRAFKNELKDTPLQYLKKVRLTKAFEQLRQQQVKIYEAAEQVGYRSVSQFSRDFKLHFGHPPTAIQNTCESGEFAASLIKHTP